MKRKLIALVSMIAAAMLLAAPASALRRGDAAADFMLKGLDGKAFSLSEQRGKVVVLNFWATWCPPCRGEMPEFNELAEELSDWGDAALFAINLTDGRRDTKEKVKEFIVKNGYNSLTVLLDDGASVADHFGVRYIPTTFVLDRGGKISGVIQGAATKENVLKLVKEAK